VLFNYKFQLGKSIILKEESDNALISSGLLPEEVLRAAFLMKQEGIKTRVINMSFIKPMVN